MKRSIIYAVAGIVVLCFGIPPRAKGDCNSILNATYGWQIEDGLVAAGNSPGPTVGDFVPAATAGHFTFDGNGNVSGAHDTNFGGVLHHIVDSGTYSVNSDCIRGTISLPGDDFTMSIAITTGGQEIKFVSATTGRTSSGTMRLVATAPCSASTLTGHSYGYATHGLVGVTLAPGFPRIGGFVPFSNAGQISFKADGIVSGVDNVNLGGAVVSGLLITGTYSVNSDCTGTTTMTISGLDHSWSFVILRGADHIIFVAMPTGFVWAGTLTKE